MEVVGHFPLLSRSSLMLFALSDGLLQRQDGCRLSKSTAAILLVLSLQLSMRNDDVDVVVCNL